MAAEVPANRRGRRKEGAIFYFDVGFDNRSEEMKRDGQLLIIATIITVHRQRSSENSHNITYTPGAAVPHSARRGRKNNHVRRDGGQWQFAPGVGG